MRKQITLCNKYYLMKLKSFSCEINGYLDKEHILLSIRRVKLPYVWV